MIRVVKRTLVITAVALGVGGVVAFSVAGQSGPRRLSVDAQSEPRKQSLQPLLVFQSRQRAADKMPTVGRRAVARIGQGIDPATSRDIGKFDGLRYWVAEVKRAPRWCLVGIPYVPMAVRDTVICGKDREFRERPWAELAATSRGGTMILGLAPIGYDTARIVGRPPVRVRRSTFRIYAPPPHRRLLLVVTGVHVPEMKLRLPDHSARRH
jgi:hypothetical protein